MIEIRDCEPGDAAGLFALFKDWDRSRDYDEAVFRESFESALADPAIRIILAREEGEIVGYGQLSERRNLGAGPSLRVDQLLVDSSRRSGGIGKALMARVEEMARQGGFSTVSLHSQVQRSRAHVFYEGLGYELKKISKYFEKPLG
jgi:GNAT superfamily N-acetyltransferase